MLHFRCSDVPKRDASSKPRNRDIRPPRPLTQTSPPIPPPNPGVTNYIRFPQASSQIQLPDLLQTQKSLYTASKANLPDLPRPSPRPTSQNLLQTQESLLTASQTHPRPPNPGIATEPTSQTSPDLLQTQESLHTASKNHPRPPPNPEFPILFRLHNTTQHFSTTQHDIARQRDTQNDLLTMQNPNSIGTLH